MPIRLFNTMDGPVAEIDGHLYADGSLSWDRLLNADDLAAELQRLAGSHAPLGYTAVPGDRLLAPLGTQEVWAAGVTYYRSRTARMEESRVAGGGSFYDRVYLAERPELFFKATPHRVVGPGGSVRMRRDSQWSVPEPELALVVNTRGTIVGCTIGNDMSARDIEGENPLYLPQAKVYAACCGLGPAVLVGRDALDPETEIRLEIVRAGQSVFEGVTRMAMMKRGADELVEFLFRDNSFPAGCVLLTGTGIVPPDEFALVSGDTVRITVSGIGTLENRVVVGT
jgi:2-dehydro-3-deoxy-D-arabinonate dehydratase